MDWAYLIKAGVGIPDYWHPRLVLQPHFANGTIGLYPISMDVKADYPGELNEDAVPVVYWNQGGVPPASPVDIILYGLGSHDAFLNTRKDSYYQQLYSVLKWLERRATPLGSGVGWLHTVDVPVYGLVAPWSSGITQGFALSLLLRACRIDLCGPWLELARDTWRSFHTPVENGGFLRRTRVGVVYEEYPGPDLDCVFNGMCHSLIGLWEAWQSGVIPEAEYDFKQGVTALHLLLPRFTYKRWSLYSLSHCMGRPLLASPYYHRANALLAQIIGSMVDAPAFIECGSKWLLTSNSLTWRLAMSARIGAERYLCAPSMLHSDKSKRPPKPSIANPAKMAQ